MVAWLGQKVILNVEVISVVGRRRTNCDRLLLTLEPARVACVVGRPLSMRLYIL